MFHRENRIRQHGGEAAIRDAERSVAVSLTEEGDDQRLGGSPSDTMIRSRAHEIYLERNGGPGDAPSDWLRAEFELGSHRGDGPVQPAETARPKSIETRLRGPTPSTPAQRGGSPVAFRQSRV